MAKFVSRDPRTTPPVRISYPTVVTPRAFAAGDDPKFSVVMMFDKKNKDHMSFLKDIREDLQACLEEKWPDAANRPRTPLVGATLSPIKDGDKTVNREGIPYKEKNPEYEGHFFIRASTKKKPVLADRNCQEIIDANEIYGGCFCKVRLNVYAYAMPKSKGLTFGLNGVQKWGDGESFGGSREAMDEMFDADGGQDDAENYSNDFDTGGDPLTDDTPDDEIPF